MIIKSTKLSLLCGLLVGLLALYGTSACKKDSGGDDPGGSSSSGGSGDDDDDDNGGPGGNGGLEVGNTDNELAVSYPEGLNITAFPAESTSSSEVVGTVSVESTLALVEALPPQPCNEGDWQFQCYVTDPDFKLGTKMWQRHATNHGLAWRDVSHGDKACVGILPTEAGACADGEKPEFSDSVKKKSFKKREDEYNRLAGGEDTVCFSDDVIRSLSTPSDASDGCFEFDHGIMKGTSCASGGEACLVSTGRAQISAASQKVEAALGVVQAMLCQAKKDDSGGLPDAGKTLTLTKSLQGAAKGREGAPTITLASIKRLSDQSGRPVYLTSLDISHNGESREFRLAHSPKSDEDNSNYDGVLFMKSPMMQQRLALTQMPSSGNALLSVKYQRAGEGDDVRLKMDIRKAVLKDSLEPFNKYGEVDYNSGANSSGLFPGQNNDMNSNDYIGGISRFMFDVNPITTEGNIAFWVNPGGRYEEAARGFVFDISYNSTTGYLAGCGIAGANRHGLNDAPGSIRKSVALGKDLKPNGFFTPNMCPSDGDFPHNGGYKSDNVGLKVWKQCFSQTSDGVYIVDGLLTKSTSGFDVISAAAAGATDVALPDVSGIKKITVK